MTRRRRRRDLLYLAAVAVLAVAFGLDVLSRATLPGAGTTPAAHGSAGRPRDVDVELLRRRIRDGELSDQEALYASPLGEDAVKDDE